LFDEIFGSKPPWVKRGRFASPDFMSGGTV
jgi:hypothetical protein